MGLIKHLRRRIEAVGVTRAIQVERRREFHGSRKHGWTICPDGISAASVGYSLGVGTDVSFDVSLIKRYGLTVYAFDPTPQALRWIGTRRLPERFHLVPCGIAGYDGSARFTASPDPGEASHTLLPEARAGEAVEAPVSRLATAMERLGHRRLDLLKMDVEGAEYEVIEDLLASALDVGQILVEFHHRFRGVGREKTNAAIEQLNAAGYRIFHISASGREYAFIRPGASVMSDE